MTEIDREKVDTMTKLRKTLLAVAIAAAVTVPVGVAYAANGNGTGGNGTGGNGTGGRGPQSGMMTGQDMDPADCQKDHAAHHAQMQKNRGDMDQMHDGTGAAHGMTGSTTTPGT